MTSYCDYDVVIAGGGMVGATLACALQNSELQVAVLEGRPLQGMRPEMDVDLRVSAITQASQQIFAAVGAWDKITAWRVSPFREMRVWDAVGSGHIHFDSANLGEPLLGWIIENRVIQAALLDCIQGLPNTTLLCPATLDLATVHQDCIHIRLADGRELTTRLLVGADGPRSQVRHWAGIDITGWSYGQKALVTMVKTEQPHSETAWQQFLPSGPLAFLPLHDGRSAIVWSTTPSHAETLLKMDRDPFALALAEAFKWRLGGITGVGPRDAFPLRLQHAHAYVKPRIALIGDAAHVVHPLAGQGVNLGILDAATLAEVLTDATALNDDIGSPKTLRRYERWRKGENLLMLGALDGFKRLFGSSLPAVRWLRNVGLNVADTVSPVKNLMARRAMGLAGDLPRLARRFR
jgi:2-octaprenylphenol hydroxylase